MVNIGLIQEPGDLKELRNLTATENFELLIATDKKKIGDVIDEMSHALTRETTIFIYSVDVFKGSFISLVELVEFLVGKEVPILFVKENISLPRSLDAASFLKQVKRLRFFAHSNCVKRGLNRQKKLGIKLGRPTENILENEKLKSQEKKIRQLLNDQISVSGISRILKIHRHTLKKFLDAKKWI